MSKLFYYFDYDSGVYTESKPIEFNQWDEEISYPNTTKTPPLETKNGFVLVWNRENLTWNYVENHKDEEGFVNGEEFTITDYGPYPEGWTKDKPLSTLEEAKTAKLAELEAKRDTLEQEGFPYMVAVFHSDSLSVQRLGISAQTAALALQTGTPFEVDWTVKGGGIVTMNAQDMLGVLLAISTHANTLHIEGRRLKALVEKAENFEDVESVVWPSI